MLESDDLGDLLFPIDFYLEFMLTLKLSNFRFNSSLKDFFFGFFCSSIYYTKSSRIPFFDLYLSFLPLEDIFYSVF